MSLRIVRAVLGAVALLTLSVPAAQAKDVRISVKTKYYNITGKSAQEFAYSMSKRGPYSYQHRRHAWATAARDLNFQLIRRKKARSCAVKGAKVHMKITYTMPRLSRTKGISARQRKNWKRMYALLQKHERVHGNYYKQLANKTYNALRKLRPAANCRQLDRKAMQVVKKLSAEDSRRNDRFDVRDKANYRQMERIYSGS